MRALTYLTVATLLASIPAHAASPLPHANPSLAPGTDCNNNGVPDATDLANGNSQDCNGNGVPDECDIAGGTSLDLDQDGVPDECRSDCDGDLIPDFLEIAFGTQLDCNVNGVPDDCEVSGGGATDCNANGVLDSCECTITNYCGTSPNSVKAGATISSGGSPFLPANDLLLMASGMPAGNFGLFFYAQQQGQAPFGEGTLCLTGQLFRLPAQQTSGTGSATRLLDFANPPIPAGQITPGSTWSFRFGYRDPAGGPAGSNTTDGLEVTFCTSPGQEVTVLETFLTQDAQDARASGAAWGSGRLTPGQGGGSGRLGELVVPAGAVVTLDTDLQTFSLGGVTNPVMSNDVPGVDYDPLDPQAWPTVTVDGDPNGEGFESSRIDIDGTLVVTGSRPLRLCARGEAVIDLSGETPEPHVSNSGGDQAANPSDGQLTAAGGLGGAGSA